MTASALGHPLATLRDGVTGFAGDRSRPMPLAAMRVEVAIGAGLAVVTTTRRFRNAESEPIEAVLTFPVAFDAVVTGLSAQVDGRTLTAQARAREDARAVYEDALDRGKLAILHEEALKGVHVLSVGQLGPGAEVAVTVETVTPLALAGDTAVLRIPTTVGALYGASPLTPADDLVTGEGALGTATLAARADGGTLVLDGRGALAGDATVPLDRPIVLRLEGGSFGERTGRDAFGRQVRLSLAPAPRTGTALDVAVLFDRSGSTGHAAGASGETVWHAMRRGLSGAFAALGQDDRVALWQFDSECKPLGGSRGTGALSLLDYLGAPAGGTELGAAVERVAKAGARDVLVLTDGQTHASEAQAAAAQGCRISAVLVGDGSLDAGVGHLAALTGGQVAWAPVDAVGPVIATALDGLRLPARATTGTLSAGRPSRIEACRAGVALAVSWQEGPRQDAGGADAVGRYAAALALPLLPAGEAGAFAAAHGLCTHLTSLVLVDEAGEAQEGLPAMRKVPLAPLAAFAAPSMAAAPAVTRVPAINFAAVMHYDIAPSMPSPPRPGYVAWGRLGPRLVKGDLDGLPPSLRAHLARMADLDPVQHLARSLGIPSMLAALALLARDAGFRGDRHAARVAARLLASADPALVDEAADAFSLFEDIWGNPS
jgi:hypothetical protein